jgi:DNA topoisomerase-1
VSNNGINATIPDNKNPEEVTLDEAVTLIEARAEKTGAKPAPRRKGPRKADARVAKPAADARPKSAKAAKPKKKAAAKPAKKSLTAAE